MYRKLVLLVSFVLVLSLAGSASAALPDGWRSLGIGTNDGSAVQSNGTWKVSGAGDDVWGSSDKFHYAYVSLTGDGQISARVVDNGIGSNSWAKGGVMIRETLSNNSKNAVMAMTGGAGGGMTFQCRPHTGGTSFSSHSDLTASPPYWVMLKREGNTITGYSSEDGVNWVQQPDSSGTDQTPNPVEIDMAEQIYFGLFVTSHAGGEVRTYTIDNVTVEFPVLAYAPSPGNGAVYPDTWAGMSWKSGLTAVSHDVYFGENVADVEAGTGDTFQGNQNSQDFIVGISGFPYPEGLVPGTTYYWRVDEVEADDLTKHTGDVWNFTIPPRTAYDPVPADNAASVDVQSIDLTWKAGIGANMHIVYFSDNYDEVENAAWKRPQRPTTYATSPLKMAKTYYWRVDEYNFVETQKGSIWSFTTEGAVSSSSPANGAVDVKQTAILSWSPGVFGASHEVYFGKDKEAVRNADTSSPEYKGSGNIGSESYDPGKLEWQATYYWRIDEANNANADSPWTGPVWSFTTANFLVVDDFESYDDLYPDNNRIFRVWIDGLDDPSVNGSVVGYDSPPFAEQTIVHSDNQSMPMSYDNAAGISEATLRLTYPRDWTENGVDTLIIWYVGDAANAAEPIYVALNDSAVVTNDNPDAARITEWTQWNIDLQKFADQGVNLSNVNSITLGLGNKSNPVAGGSGIMYFDDIRLYQPLPEPEQQP